MRITPLKKKDIKLLVRALCFLKPYIVKFVFVIVCIFIGIALGIIQPLIWGKLITALFSEKYKDITMFISLLLLLYCVQVIVMYFQSYIFSYLNENIIYDIKKTMYSKILNLKIEIFDRMPVGDFLSRLQGDTTVITNIITNQLLNSVVDIIKALIIGVLVFSINVYLGLIVLISFPLTYIVYFIFGSILKRLNQKVKTLTDSYYSSTQESLSNIRDVKNLGLKDKNFKLFTNINSQIKILNIKIAVTSGIANSISIGLTFLSQIIIYSVGAYLIYNKSLSLEYFIAFTSYSQQFTSSLSNITSLNSNIQQALVSLDRVFNLMDEMQFEQEIFGAEHVEEFKGDIILNDISFSYKKDIEIIKHISVKIMANKKYAIVGKNGSGKTTIFNLLLRLYDPDEGKITVDGINIKDIDENSLRKNISIVSQEPLLFNLSIRENISIGTNNSSMEEIIEACKRSYIHEFIVGLPDGYETIVSEKGINLSGGQKQKISIARALIKKSKIILLDESTSALDNEAQDNINPLINKLAKNHTVIVIEHRLLNIIDADEIIIIDNGIIAGQGSHEMLIKENEIYQELYKYELGVLNLL